jgi:pimeloyl-ACP methyl ester carboxylesterase
LLVHGGRAGISPIASGHHIWEPAISYLAADRPLVAVDLPGAGEGELGNSEVLTVERLAAHLLALIDTLSIGPVHFVGHDLGGLIGLWAAISAPSKLRSLSLVASGVSPPTGDSLDDILFDATPRPLWSRESQRWAFERLSYSHGHIDQALLAACVGSAGKEPHNQAVKVMQDETVRARNYGIGAVKGKIWQALRGEGVPVPTQLVWSSHDPQAHREGGYVLFKIIAEKQRVAQFHLINRAGSFPFREQPLEFVQVVTAFQSGVETESVL